MPVVITAGILYIKAFSGLPIIANHLFFTVYVAKLTSWLKLFRPKVSLLHYNYNYLFYLCFYFSFVHPARQQQVFPYQLKNMSFLKRLFSKSKTEEATASADQLPWIAAADNNWGIRLLDLRPITQTMLSTSTDPQMATNAVSYNGEDGTTFFGLKPPTNKFIQTDIFFSIDKTLEPGVLFTPNTMEHKWGIFFDGQFLIFVRSWLRQVFVIAKTRLENNQLIIENIQGEFTPDESPAFTKAILNFLLISHALGEIVPAPLPQHLESDLRSAGLWAFSAYGNHAQMGTFDDSFVPTTQTLLRSHSLLHIAVARSDIHGIEQQAQHGAGLNYLAGDGLAPLHWSMAARDITSMAKLLELGADPNVMSTEGATPIMNAVQSNKIDHLNLLLNAGARVNFQDHRGFTALHRAAEMGHEEIVRILLKHGADKTIETETHTALSFATMRGHQGIIDLLS